MTSKETKRNTDLFSDNTATRERFLILHNDEIHPFDYVIKALIEVCDHDYLQATQCTLITHYKGKCDVKQGKYSSLKAMKSALIRLELNATID